MAVTLIPDSPARPRVVPIARLAAGGRWRIEAMRSYAEPLLLWFTRGQGRITVSGVTRGFGAHNAIFLPAGTMHGFDMTAQTYGTALFFGRDHGLTHLPEAPQHLRLREASAQAELTSLIDQIQRESDGRRPGHDRAVHHLSGLIAICIERLALHQEPARRPDAAHRLAARFAALLERDFRQGLDIADYATALGVTPTHLSRACRQSCGRAAHDLLQDRLLFEARRLLAETSAPVKEVAKSLGFRSPAYFTRSFHQRTGKTPSAFRKGG
ncbi:helix-turn-helix domain-containing protein [Plastorhodobacter daqingensis]|uniref:Helix-turn-helix domain-containing protein n=1 Tax=Plastorhodobacter daqingensis TaxID=1387281 RepID=A0ABW2UJL6_9RHOB